MAKKVQIESEVVRRSAAQGQALVARWRASGESVTSFCRRAGLGAQVLRYWLAREKVAVERVSSPSDFFVVTAPQSASPAETVGLANEAVAAGSRMTSAFIVVVPAASLRRRTEARSGL
jgi:hypothetical protein